MTLDDMIPNLRLVLGVPERDCRLPIAERVSNIVSELKEWRSDYAEAAMKLERADGALQRLRERLQRAYEHGGWPTYKSVLEWIDEEQAKERGAR